MGCKGKFESHVALVANRIISAQAAGCAFFLFAALALEGIPALPGCISQGKTEREALKNIREAIRLHVRNPNFYRNGIRAKPGRLVHAPAPSHPRPA